MRLPIRGLLSVAAGAGRGRLKRREREIATQERERTDERENLRDILSLADASFKMQDQGGSIIDISDDAQGFERPGEEIGRATLRGRTLSVRRDPTQGRRARRERIRAEHEKRHPGELPDMGPEFDIEDFVAREGTRERETKDERTFRTNETTRRVDNLMTAVPGMTRARAYSIVEENYDPVEREANARERRSRMLDMADEREDRGNVRRAREEDRESDRFEKEVAGVLDAYVTRFPNASVDDLIIHQERMYGPKVSPGRRQGLASGAIIRRDRAKMSGGSILDDDGFQAPSARTAPSVPPASGGTQRPGSGGGAVREPQRPGASAGVGTRSLPPDPELDALIDSLIAQGKTEDEITEIIAKRGKSGR